jgi:hypothetical protein
VNAIFFAPGERLSRAALIAPPERVTSAARL